MKSNIQFCDLRLPADSETLIWEKAKQVVQRNAYILGEEVHTFENEFAQYCDTSDCIGVATGCDALLWTMEALGIGKGDEVITVANTFIGTVLPIIRAGATPVLVDCDPITQQIHPKAVALRLRAKLLRLLRFISMEGWLRWMNSSKFRTNTAYFFLKMPHKHMGRDTRGRELEVWEWQPALVFIQLKILGRGAMEVLSRLTTKSGRKNRQNH